MNILFDGYLTGGIISARTASRYSFKSNDFIGNISNFLFDGHLIAPYHKFFSAVVREGFSSGNSGRLRFDASEKFLALAEKDGDSQ